MQGWMWGASQLGNFRTLKVAINFARQTNNSCNRSFYLDL